MGQVKKSLSCFFLLSTLLASFDKYRLDDDTGFRVSVADFQFLTVVVVDLIDEEHKSDLG